METTATPLTGSPPPNTSIFHKNIDISSSFNYALASGSAITPIDNRRSESLYWFFGHTTGAGIFNGTPRYFQGIRVVDPNEPTFIHLFPDVPRPDVDLCLTCRNCGKEFPIVGLPQTCSECGYSIRG